jgi:ADP-dependent NAD(P)H-hydrate dehydratase / NAD(P)H-hydrate epimerase
VPDAPPRPLSSAEMAVVEQNAVALGISVDALMEQAGRAVAEEATRHLPPPPARVAVVASTGNKGGDGLCATHYLAQWGYSPEVWLVRPPSEFRSRAAQRRYDRVAGRLPLRQRLPSAEELATMPLVIDALLGTGQSAGLRSPIREAVAAVRASGAPVLSIDLPTGVFDPEGLQPQFTVALHSIKSEMDPARAGAVVVREIGIPPEAWNRTGPGEFVAFRRPEPRRGRSARLVVIGGGPYSGAPALAALAALRTGAERATVVAPAGAAERIQSFSPNLVVRAVGNARFGPADSEEVVGFVRETAPRALVMGMGAGADPGTISFFREVLGKLAGHVPMVVDADALAALPDAAPGNPPNARSPLIATPNAGELAHRFGIPSDLPDDRRRAEVSRVARERRLLLLAKGEPDLLSDGEVTVENRHHHPAMTVSGVGDVLGGAVGSLLAQGLPALDAARLGTYWVGEAGILAASRRSFGLVATEVVDELPTALAHGLARLSRVE